MPETNNEHKRETVFGGLIITPFTTGLHGPNERP